MSDAQLVAASNANVVYSGQSRFRRTLKPGNDVYVVWLNNWLESSTGLTAPDRNAAMKAVYNYAL